MRIETATYGRHSAAHRANIVMMRCTFMVINAPILCKHLRDGSGTMFMRMDSELFTNAYSWLAAPADWRTELAQMSRAATSELRSSSS